MSWESVRIGEVAEIEHGFAFKSKYFTEKRSQLSLVTPGNFELGGGFNPAKYKFYDGPFEKRYVLCPGDLLVNMTDLSRNSDTLGSPSIVPIVDGEISYLHNQRIGKIRIKSESVTTRFLYYSMRLESTRQQIVATATGTTVKHTSPTRIQDAVINIPSPLEQIAIADVLGALDDKIAANQRVLRTSNELLRVKYLQLMDGPRILFNQIAAEAREKVEPRSVEGTMPQVSLEHFEKKSLWLQNWGRAAEVDSAKSRFLEGDLLFGKLRPYFHKVAIAPVEGICSTDVLVIRAIEPKQRALVALAGNSDQMVDRAVMNSNGTRMPRAKWADLELCEVPDPATAAVQVFCRFGEALFQKAQKIIQENQVLARTRDELLPLLMNGKISVAEASEAVEEVVGKHKEGDGDV